MNKQMIWGMIRHFITIVSSAFIANSAETIDTVIPLLMKNIISGDIPSIVSTVLLLASILWSLWVKATEETKNNIKVKLFIKKA